MRDILFRGKRVDNGEWIEGYYFCAMKQKVAPFHGIFMITVFNGVPYTLMDNCEVDYATIGQYTGLTDKNGKKIWENDILKTKFGRLCKVIWFSSEQYNGWDLTPIFSELRAPDKWDLFYPENLEVIGNVYDNPDMLTGKGGCNYGSV